MTASPGRSWSLRRFFDRLGVQLSLSVAVALLPLGLIAVLQTFAVIREAQERSEAALMGVTLRAASREVRLISQAQGAASALAQSLTPVLGDPGACSAELDDLIEESPQYSFVAYVPLDGPITCSTRDDLADVDEVFGFDEAAASRRPTFVVNGMGALSGTSNLAVTHPVFDPEGQRMGWITIAMPHATLARRDPLVDPAVPVERSVTLVTFDSTGTVLTASIPLETGAVSTAPVSLEEAARTLPIERNLALLATGDDLSFTSVSAGGEARVYSVAPIITGQLYAMGSWPKPLADYELGASLSPLLLPIAMWVASLFVAWFATNRLVVRHIATLRRSMGLFASGTRSVGQLRTESAPIEIREVSEAYLQMTETILRDEAEMEDMIHQKEVLLREVHHRVKNNLQLIASIMNLQMRTAHSPEARRLIRGLQERVMSLATVHKELYQTSGLTRIHADELLAEIVQQIVRLSTAPGRPIDLRTEFAPIRLLPDQAVPLSLFVTEALTNALKYAGLGETQAAPRIGVRFTLEENGQALLEITNSLPAPGASTEEVDGGTGLGFRLLAAFAMQVGGTHEAQRIEDAFRVRLWFEPAATPDEEVAELQLGADAAE